MRLKKAINWVNSRYTEPQQERILSAILIAIMTCVIIGIPCQLLYERITNPSPYRDIRSDNWAYASMTEFVARGYYSETERAMAGRYACPGAGVEYEEVLSIMEDMFWTEEYGTREEYRRNLLRGTNIEVYKDTNKVLSSLTGYPTRYEMAQIAYNHLLLTGQAWPDSGTELRDGAIAMFSSGLPQIPARYCPAVFCMMAKGIMSGTGSGFKGDGYTNRAQIATILLRLSSLQEESKNL